MFLIKMYDCTRESHFDERKAQLIRGSFLKKNFVKNPYIKKLFVVGGDESGETTTCHGDSGSPVVRRVASSRIGTRLVMIVRV